MAENIEKVAGYFYDLAWKAAIPFLSKNNRLKAGLNQRNLKEKLPKADIWIQAASAGEAYLAQSLLNKMSIPRPLHVLMTSNTRQGMNILKAALSDMPCQNHLKISAAYFPFDRPAIMKQAAMQVFPRVMVLLETELWPGLLMALKEAGRKILIINGRITPKSLRHYQLCSSVWKKLAPDRILAVSSEDAGRFAALFGTKAVSVMHNMKFDRIGIQSTQETILDSLKNILPPKMPFLVMASVRKKEEPLIIQMIQRILANHPETVIGLFPRHMHRLSQWEKTLNIKGIPWKFRSVLTYPESSCRVILWDRFGELAASYHLAKAAFVGGSLVPSGGQNFLEPLVCGVIPVIGPHWSNFHWVGRQIFDQGLVRKAEDWKMAADMVMNIMKSEISRKNLQNRALDYIQKRQGGTRKSWEIIRQYIG